MFLAIVNGHIPIESVNETCHLKLLQEVAWPVLKHKAASRSYWWIQDGVLPHCTTLAKAFILEKFPGRVISRGTSINWPTHSPDLNSLDSHF